VWRCKPRPGHAFYKERMRDEECGVWRRDERTSLFPVISPTATSGMIPWLLVGGSLLCVKGKAMS